MSKIGKVLLGTDHSFGNQPIRSVVTTTADFGFCQPVFRKFLSSKESLNISFKQLVRNSAMPCPTYCDIRSHNKAVFVPMSDVFPAFDALLSEVPVPGDPSNYVPKSVTSMSYSNLWSYIFSSDVLPSFCYYTFCTAERDTSILDSGVHLITVPCSSQNFDSRHVMDRYGISYVFSDPDTYNLLGSDDRLNADNSDFIFVNEDNYGTGRAAVCFVKLSASGRRLFKIFYGLGLSLDPFDPTPVDILPLFAYYKAWFDSYSPLRNINWHATAAYWLIRYVYNTGNALIPFYPTQTGDVYNRFNRFLRDLSDCYYTDKDDFVSVHTDKLYPSSFDSEGSVNLRNAGIQNSSIEKRQDGVYVPSVPLNTIILKTLTRLTKYVTKDSVIGRNVQEWMRVHFGSETSEDMFRQAYNLGDYIVDARVDEIFSTSDTVNGDTGEHLGAYAGKGLGFGQGKLEFTAPAPGYVFIMQSIVSDSEYYQGTDPTLYACGKYDFPDRAYDALGYEVTRKASIYDQNGLFLNVQNQSEGFGYIPRYSGWKVTPSIVNGLMRFNSERKQYDAFHLLRTVKPTSYNSDTNHGLVYHFNTVPNASVAWRYNGRYPQLTDYNRIFAFQGDPIYFEPFRNYFGVDNFIVQMIIEGNHRSILKPITESYDVFDGSDTSQASVSAE